MQKVRLPFGTQSGSCNFGAPFTPASSVAPLLLDNNRLDVSIIPEYLTIGALIPYNSVLLKSRSLRNATQILR
jgi:hypothetical protein